MILIGKKLYRLLLNKLAQITNGGFSKPELFYLKLTERCNLACHNCDIWKTTDHQELGLEQWQKIILDIKSISPRANVIISGGEPFLSPIFWPLVKFIKDRKLTITVNTNGSLLTDDIILKIIEYKIDRIELSLYSLEPETLTKIRGSQLASQSIAALERLIKHGLNKKVIIAWLLTKYNLEETPMAINYFTKNNIAISLQPLDSNVQALGALDLKRSDIKHNSLWPDNKEVITAIFEKIIHQKKTGALIHNRLSQLKLIKDYYLEDISEINKLPCHCGVKNFIISSQGQVYFCFSQASVGSLLEKSASDIWKSPEAKYRRHENKTCTKPCRIMNCNYQPSLTKMIKEYIIKQVIGV